MEEKELEFFERIKAIGVDVVKPTETQRNPLSDIYDIHNIKEVATVVCGVVNTAVNKKGIIGWVGILPDIYPALQDISQVVPELKDMTEEEVLELKAHIKLKLHFEGDPARYEEAIEDLVIITLLLILNALKLIALTNQLKKEKDG